MKASVSKASTMQPRRIQAAVDEHRYASPQSRPLVESIARGARVLREAGFCPGDVGSVAVRRSEREATIVMPGSDLRNVDNRCLESVSLESGHSPVLRGVAAGAAAAAWAFPPHLLVLAAGGRVPDSSALTFDESPGPIVLGDWAADEIPSASVVMFAGRGVLSMADDPLDAVHNMELAEALAQLTVLGPASD